MRRIVAFTLLMLILLLSGCECMSGLGRDIQHAGKWLEDVSNRVGS